MGKHITAMREACILSNVNLTRMCVMEDFKYTVNHSKNRKLVKHEVHATEKSFKHQTDPVSDWEVDLFKSTNDVNLLSSEQRNWLKFAYNGNSTEHQAQKICKPMIVSFNKSYDCKKSRLNKLESLFSICIRCVSYELFTGKKVLTKKAIANSIGISYSTYVQLWKEHHNWAISYLIKLDEDTMQLLAERLQDEKYITSFNKS